jgi:DNA-binding LacI/PurR family transcriptional regulator
MTFVIDGGARHWESALTACYKERVTTFPSVPPTLEDVARVAGVSRATVSRVVNSVRNVDPKLRETVERAIADTGYVPNRAARSLVSRHTGGIALVVSEPERHIDAEAFTGGVFGDPFFGRVVEGVVAHLRPHGRHPLLMLVDSDEERAKLVAKLRQEQVSGVLLISLAPDQDPLPLVLTEAGVPTALFARPARPAPVCYVDVAHQDGARLAADRLVSRGCRRVATIAGPGGTPAGHDRLAGFRDAMARHGHAYVAVAEGDFTQHGGELAMERLLATEPELDGVFVANDLMAYGALSVLAEAGRRVPDDIAVIGFDDSRVALSCRPRLTTIRQPVEAMGAAMARMVLDRMADPALRAESVIFDPELVVRDSA